MTLFLDLPELPDTLRPIAAELIAPPSEQSPTHCANLAPLLDWFYTARWLTERASDTEAQSVLPWFTACQPTRAAELADVLCYRLIETGQIIAAIDLAEPVLARTADGALRHTFALALLANGRTQDAIHALETAVNQDPPHTLPGEQRISALLDLARIYQGQHALFKAIKPAKTAIALAAEQGADELFLEAATLLVDQLVEQGGADEAWTTLAPFLTSGSLTSQKNLWTLAFNRLGEQLSAAELAAGARCFINARTPDPLVQLLIRRSNAHPPAPTPTHDERQLALLLALAFHAPIDVIAPLASQLLMRDQDRQHPSAPLIAAASMAVAERPDHRSGKRAHWHRDAMVQFISVAKHQGVPEAAVKLWATDEKLLREHGVIWRAVEQLTQELSSPPEWLPDALALAKTQTEIHPQSAL